VWENSTFFEFVKHIQIGNLTDTIFFTLNDDKRAKEMKQSL
jgi:hypothetical protein